MLEKQEKNQVWLLESNSQAGSNLNLSEFNNYVINYLELKKYVKYVDDIVIISNNKKINQLYPIVSKKISRNTSSHEQKILKLIQLIVVYNIQVKYHIHMDIKNQANK